MNFRLYRSRDRVVAGVAGGVADALDLDPSLVRIVWALAMFAGFPILVYIVMAIVVPEEPGDWEPWRPTPESPRTTPAGVVPATPDVPPTSGWSSTSGPSVAAADETTGTFPADAATSPEVPPTAPAPGHDSWRESRWAERDARRAQRRAERWERRSYRRDGTGAVVFGLILILVGAAFLAHQLVPSLNWDEIWPIGLVAIGVLLLVGSLTRRPAE